jgi:hypothetical protein
MDLDKKTTQNKECEFRRVSERKTGGCRAEVWPGNFLVEKYS